MCVFRDMLVGVFIFVYRLSDICMCLNLMLIRIFFFRLFICFWFFLRSCFIWILRLSIFERVFCRVCLVISCLVFFLLIFLLRFFFCKYVNKIWVCIWVYLIGDCRLLVGLKCMVKYYLIFYKIVLFLIVNSI